MDDISRILQNLRDLVTSFQKSNVQGMTPHLYISIIPFWENKFNFKPSLQKIVRIQKRSLVTKTIQTNVISMESGILSVAFAPSGMKIVSGTENGMVTIWDSTAGAQLGDCPQGHKDTVRSVAFSLDGTRIVSGSHDGTVRMWDATTGAQLGDSLQGHDDWVTSVAFLLMEPELCQVLMIEQ
jgi:WD40 repeat protein